MSTEFGPLIDRMARARRAELIALRHRLHQHPELSNRERTTSALVAGHLRSLGLDEVRTGIAGYGVVGVLRGGLPGDRVAALRADMDALPVAEASGLEFASTAIDDGYPGGPTRSPTHAAMTAIRRWCSPRPVSWRSFATGCPAQLSSSSSQPRKGRRWTRPGERVPCSPLEPWLTRNQR